MKRKTNASSGDQFSEEIHIVDLLAELHRLSVNLERTPRKEDMAEHGDYSIDMYNRRLGSWTAALGSAGLESDQQTDNSKSEASDEELLAELQRLGEELGWTPRIKDMREHGEYTEHHYYDCFGSWNEAVKMAGFEPNTGVSVGEPSPNKIPDDELIAELQRLGGELGETPGVMDMVEKGAFSKWPYQDRFGSWCEALKAAGFSPNIGASDEALIEELQRLADDLGRTPTTRDMAEYGRRGYSVYISHFSTWNGALKTAGLDPVLTPNIPEEDLLDEIRRLADRLGRTPLTLDMDADGAYHCGTYSTRFGSWNDALDAAGFDPVHYTDISDQDLLSELQRLADVLGRSPRASDMEAEGKYSHLPYYQRFESWSDALDAAGYEPSWPVYGEDHPLWEGGRPNYGKGWNEKKRELVRERDNRTCQSCGRSEEDHLDLRGQKLSVHHIQKARAFDDPEKRNHPDNLVTLCETAKCHRKWEQMSPLRPQLSTDDTND